jgi:hypothetical protein
LALVGNWIHKKTEFKAKYKL